MDLTCHLPVSGVKGMRFWSVCQILFCLSEWSGRKDQRIDEITATSFWLHLLSSPLVLSHSFNRCLSPFPQFIYSLAPPSISSFFFSFLHTLLLLFNKIITLHVQGTSISSEHVLSSSTLSFPLLSLPSQRWAEPMLFQIIQLLKLILS